MLQFIVFLFMTFTFAEIDRQLDINVINPRTSTIEGITFPRMSEIKYRGTPEIQMDRQKAIKAMLGGQAPLESILFSAVKLMLMKERVPFYDQIHSTIESRNIPNKIQNLISTNNDKAFSEDEAITLAFRIIEDDLIGKFKSGYFIDHYVDYRSPQYELFPQDVIFSTVYLEVANIYSRFITLIEDTDYSMVDLNYWNRIRNGAWVFTARKWVDRGEFISPIVIESEKIKGYMEYASQVPDWRIFRPLPNELDLAFMKVKYGEENLILVFDGAHKGQRASAITFNNGLFHLADSQFSPDLDVPKQLVPRKSTAALMGIIKLCPEDDHCTLKNPEFSKYRRSIRELDKASLSRISSLRIDGLVPKLFYNEGTLPSDKISTQPHRPVYPAPEVILANIINDSKNVKYSIADSPTSPTPAILRWSLNGQKLLNGEMIYFEIPESFRRRKISKVNLLHRQDSLDNSTPLSGRFDKSPAYTSVQFYALTEDTADFWRYWGGSTRFNNPKGSFFADIKSETDMTLQSLTNWSNTKGHETDLAQDFELSIGAMRIVGVGVDPSTLYTIELEFEK